MAKPALQGALLFLALAGSALLHAAAVPEYELKLAITYRVTKFVDWPANVTGGIEFRFCVYRQNPFEELLEGLRGRSVGNLDIDVTIVQSAEDAASRCDLLFIAVSEAREVPDLIEVLQGRQILTISDTPGFAEQGGIIELVTRENKVGFRVNVEALRKSQLEISSQLLQLAELVRGQIR